MGDGIAGCERSGRCVEVLRGAEALAEARGDRSVASTHLLLAIMAQSDSAWPRRIAERGGMCFGDAMRRLGWRRSEALERLVDEPPPVHRPSMRLVVILVLASKLRVALLRLRHAPRHERPRWDLGAVETVAIAERLAAARGSTPLGVGHLLLALASSPGPHLRLLDNATVLACAVRKELGLAAWHHRLVLACDLGNLQLRRLRMRLGAEVAIHGRASAWGAASAVYACAGLLTALVLFVIVGLANLLLYLFLWPGAILMTGFRTLSEVAAGCGVRSHRWHEIPGGEIGFWGDARRLRDRTAAAVVFAPRVLAFLCSTAALVVILWRSQRLGVSPLPTVYARPDIVTGANSDSLWLAPLVILVDFISQYGGLAGVGLLAGLGVGFMSLPTYRELALIRLYTGHDVGFGSRLGRRLSLPAALLTGALACVEALLPFRNGPIFLTIYVIPVFVSAMCAAAIVGLLPY